MRLLDHRPRRPLAWLYAVARNLATDALRDRTRRRRGLRALAAEGPAPPPDPEEAMARRREAGRVEAALRALSERDRTLLLLRAEGLRYRQLAEILGVATTSIGPLLTRSQRRFLRAYREAAGSEGEEGLASA